MSRIKDQNEGLNTSSQNGDSNARAITALFRESRKIFRAQYKQSRNTSILIAQDTFEEFIENGLLTVPEARNVIRTPAKFADFLLKAENNFQKTENKKIHDRLSGLEHNTSDSNAYKIAGVTGAVFCLLSLTLSPFVNDLLQPVADDILKPKSNKIPAEKYTASTPAVQIILNDSRKITYITKNPNKHPIRRHRKSKISAQQKITHCK